MMRKFGKTVRIFVEIEHIKNQRVTLWPERIGQAFPMLWSGHEFIQEILTPYPILLGHNVTLQFLMCSISTNILTVLPNFLIIIIQIFSKSIGRDRGNTIYMAKDATEPYTPICSGQPKFHFQVPASDTLQVVICYHPVTRIPFPP